MLIDNKPIEEYQFFKAMIAIPCVEAIYLTGSRARGDHNERSDIDLTISCPLATPQQWEQIIEIARNNTETLLRVDPIWLEKITVTGHRNIVIHKRQLLYLKTFGGPSIIEERKSAFFDVWSKKLDSSMATMPAVDVAPNETQQKQIIESFQACFDCIWVIVRKAIAIHGMYTNTPLSSFREAYMEGWLENRLLWERMIEDYRLTTLPIPLNELPRLNQQVPLYLQEMRKAASQVMAIVKPYIHAHAVE